MSRDYSEYKAVFSVLESLRNGRNSSDIDRIENAMLESTYSVPIMEGTKAYRNLALALLCLALYYDQDFQKVAEKASENAVAIMEKIEDVAESVKTQLITPAVKNDYSDMVAADKRTDKQRIASQFKWNVDKLMQIRDISGYGVPNDIYGRYALLSGMTYDVVKKNYESARSFGIDPNLTLAMMYRESRGYKYKTDKNGNPIHVESHKGAIGPMQIMPFNAKYVKKKFNSDIYDPYENIRGGCGMVRDLLRQFHSDELAVAAYNAGSAAVVRSGYTVPQNNETPKYVDNVMETKSMFEEMEAMFNEKFGGRR